MKKKTPPPKSSSTRSHRGKNYTIYRGDSQRLLKNIRTSSVDFILTDPPYNLSRYSTGKMEFSWRKNIDNHLGAWDEKPFNPADFVDEFLRILKPTGNIFAFTSYNLLGDWHKTFDPLFDTFQFMTWHKTNPVPKFRKAGFLNSCELIVCMWNRSHTWNFISQREMHNFIETPTCNGKERLKGDEHHPTQKPLRVLSHLINIASPRRGLVLDPFMGVASSGVAALQHGRRFIGIEKEEGFYQSGRYRLEDAAGLIE